MIGLTPTERATMRSDAAGLLDQTATVRRRDAGGTWETVAEALPCLVEAGVGQPPERASDAGFAIDANVTLTTAHDADVRRGDRAVVDGRAIEIVFAVPRPVAVARFLGRMEP